MQSQDMARDLGRAVRDARRRREMTQEAVALQSGLQRKTVHQIEAGKTDARIDTLRRIARAMGVSVAHLLVPPGEG
ncbi:MAG: Helix-turn-helix domain [Solirubrobacteraceae bacterium]|jgi:transcriptional regulator with XRE-family HTH domain|nr:Helix-turn-helix domain [Solirubrobacteraceae bacterium]